MDRTTQSILGIATLAGAGIALWSLLSTQGPSGEVRERPTTAITSYRRAALPTTRAGLEDHVRVHRGDARAWMALGELRARDNEELGARQANLLAVELIEASIHGASGTNATNQLAWYTLGLIRVRLGDLDGARSAFETSVVLIEAITRREPGPNNYYNLACYRALAGQAEKAIDAFEHAIDEGWGDRRWALDDADLASVRDDARFRAALERIGDGGMMIIEGP